MKYLFINDINYLLKKRKKILLAILLVPLIVMLVNIKAQFPLVDRINFCMGTSWIDFEQSNIIEFIMLIFNLATYIFLIVDVYVKDITYQLDNIFLRIKPVNWFLKKSMVFICIISILKLFQYGILSLTIFLLSNAAFVGVIKLVFSDFVYIIFIQFLFITIYVISACTSKMKFIPYFIFGIIMIIIPKNIYKLTINELLLIVVMIMAFLLLLTIVFKRFNKKIIENI